MLSSNAAEESHRRRRRFAYVERILFWVFLTIVLPFLGAGIEKMKLTVSGPLHKWTWEQFGLLVVSILPAIFAANRASCSLDDKFAATRDEAMRFVVKAGFTILWPFTAIGELASAVLFIFFLSLPHPGGTDLGIVSAMLLLSFLWYMGALIVPTAIWSALATFRFPLETASTQRVSVAR
jgi:hypothetical protein